MSLKSDRSRAVSDAAKERQKRLGGAQLKFRKWNQVRQQAAEKATHRTEDVTREDIIEAVIQEYYGKLGKAAKYVSDKVPMAVWQASDALKRKATELSFRHELRKASKKSKK